MEKNRIHTQPYGNRIRMSFAREKSVLEMPNLLDVQKDSYNWFIDEGLREVFEDINPIVLIEKPFFVFIVKEYSTNNI